jgi:hypothetical protein
MVNEILMPARIQAAAGPAPLCSVIEHYANAGPSHLASPPVFRAAGLLGKAPLPDELRDALGIRDDAEYDEVMEIGVGPFEE